MISRLKWRRGWDSNPRYRPQIADIIIQFFHFLVKESLGRIMGMGSGAPSYWESTGAINQFSGGFQPDLKELIKMMANGGDMRLNFQGYNYEYLISVQSCPLAIN